MSEQECSYGTAGHLSKIEAYRVLSEEVGMAGVKASLRTLALLEEFLESNPRITTWADAKTGVNIVSLLMQPSSEIWAKSLGVEALITQLQDQSDA